MLMLSLTKVLTLNCPQRMIKEIPRNRIKYVNNHFDNNLKDDVIRYYNKQENYEVDEDW